jgi:hypothetical protein
LCVRAPSSFAFPSPSSTLNISTPSPRHLPTHSPPSPAPQDLFNAGIRFVCLSRSSECRTKAFGHELGLETHWNSCIDSAPDPPPPVSAAPSPTLGGGGVTKLPPGIEAVRPHLRDVDNVPLLVSLFCNCSGATAAEMVRVSAGKERGALGSGPNTGRRDEPGGWWIEHARYVLTSGERPTGCARRFIRFLLLPLRSPTALWGAALLHPGR